LSLFGELSFRRIAKKLLNIGKGKWTFWKSKKAVEPLNKKGNVSFNHEKKKNEKKLMIKIMV
jgi:hypothetical protein